MPLRRVLGHRLAPSSSALFRRPHQLRATGKTKVKPVGSALINDPKSSLLTTDGWRDNPLVTSPPYGAAAGAAS